MKNNKHILVIDDDERLRELLTTFLMSEGYIVDSAEDTENAQSKINDIVYDLIILDVMMPKESGLSFAKKIRKFSSIPILMLSAMGALENRIAGFESGVDEYLPKPFDPRELLLRINAILKRISYNNVNSSNSVSFGSILYKTNSNIIRIKNKDIYLTKNETKILDQLIQSKGHSVTRELLASLLNVSPRTIDVNINRLRIKIEKKPSHPLYLLSVRGVGYKLEYDS